MASRLVAGLVRHTAFAASPLLATDLLPLESQEASFTGDTDTLLVSTVISLPQSCLLELFKLEKRPLGMCVCVSILQMGKVLGFILFASIKCVLLPMLVPGAT